MGVDKSFDVMTDSSHVCIDVHGYLTFIDNFMLRFPFLSFTR